MINSQTDTLTFIALTLAAAGLVWGFVFRLRVFFQDAIDLKSRLSSNSGAYHSWVAQALFFGGLSLLTWHLDEDLYGIPSWVFYGFFLFSLVWVANPTKAAVVTNDSPAELKARVASNNRIFAATTGVFAAILAIIYFLEFTNYENGASFFAHLRWALLALYAFGAAIYFIGVVLRSLSKKT